MNTLLLHGFWGHPQDWNEVTKKLPLHLDLWIPDLYDEISLSPQHHLAQWSEHLHHLIVARWGREPVQVVGYSLGGRLLLNAMKVKMGAIQRALILSSRPYLSPAEILRRQVWEKTWVKKFLREEWVTLEREWQEQPVFNGSQAVPRRHDFRLREALGMSLVRWSPSQHLFAEGDLANFPSTVEWAFGALDQNYLEVAKGLQNLPVQGQITILPEAGHRLPMEASDFVADWIRQGSN